MACLSVVLFHLGTVSGVSFGPLNPFVLGGDTGVWVFFALSGYLLYKPFLTRKVDLRSYGIKRAARILPGYYVALVALVVLTGSRLPIEQPLPYLTMSASYDIPLRGFLGNAWTLSAEILFYVSLPLLARLAAGREAVVLGGLAATSAALAVVHRLALSDANAWMLGTYPLAFYAFVPGMLLAVLEVRRPSAFRRLRSPVVALIGVAYIAGGMLTSILPVAVGAVIGTPLVMASLLQHRLPGARALSFIGGASYALYLLHKDLFIAFGPGVGLAIAIVGSAASWALIERPILARAHWLADMLSRPSRIERALPEAAK